MKRAKRSTSRSFYEESEEKRFSDACYEESEGKPVCVCVCVCVCVFVICYKLYRAREGAREHSSADAKRRFKRILEAISIA